VPPPDGKDSEKELMSMKEIALASINTFGLSPKAEIEPSLERDVFILTSGQLRAIITEAVQETIQPLQEEVSQLREEIAQDRQELAALRAQVRSLEATEEQDVNRICCDIAHDRQRLARLETRPGCPAPMPPRGEKTIARIAKIDDVLKNRGPTTLKQLEHILEIDRATMTRLLGRLDMRRYELHSRPGDDREKVLRLKVQIR
jgi:septal ring factor EnvC (AmiA/AmiB activator)